MRQLGGKIQQSGAKGVRRGWSLDSKPGLDPLRKT
jgi:hypothetical protein